MNDLFNNPHLILTLHQGSSFFINKVFALNVLCFLGKKDLF